MVYNKSFWNLFIMTGDINFYLEFKNHEDDDSLLVDKDDDNILKDLDNNYLR